MHIVTKKKVYFFIHWNRSLLSWSFCPSCKSLTDGLKIAQFLYLIINIKFKDVYNKAETIFITFPAHNFTTL